MGMDSFKSSPGCHSAQSACQLKVTLSPDTSVSLGEVPCTPLKGGFQCGATNLPFIYIPGSEHGTLTLFKGKDVVTTELIRLPAKTTEETRAMQRALLSRVEISASGSYSQLYALALATVGDSKKALEVLGKLSGEWPQISLNNVIMELIADGRFQEAAQLTPHLIPEKIPEMYTHNDGADRARLLIAHVALSQGNEAPFRKLLQEKQGITDLPTKCRHLFDMVDIALARGHAALATEVMRVLLEAFEKSEKDNQNGDKLLGIAILLERLGRLDEAQAMIDRIPKSDVVYFYRKFEIAFRLAVATGRKDDQMKLMDALLAQPLDVDKVSYLIDLIKLHQVDPETLRRVVAEGLKKNEPAANHHNMMVDVLWTAGFQAEARQAALSVKDCHDPDAAFQEHYEVAALRGLAEFSGNVKDAKAVLQRIQKIKDTKEREAQLAVTLDLLAPHDKARALALAEKLSGDNKARAMLDIAVTLHDFPMIQRSVENFAKNGENMEGTLDNMIRHGMKAEAFLIIDGLTNPESKAVALINGALSLGAYRHWLSQ